MDRIVSFLSEFSTELATFVIATLPAGLGAGDFGMASFGTPGDTLLVPVTIIPEPGTVLLLLVGCCGLLLWRRRWTA